MRIQHNIAALNSYRNLTGNNSAVSKNLEKLSSGYRINRAGDDAAGLAISDSGFASASDRYKIKEEYSRLPASVLISTHYKKPPVNEKDMPPVYLTGRIRIDRWLLLLHPLFPHKCDRPHFLPLYIVDTGDASAVVR